MTSIHKGEYMPNSLNIRTATRYAGVAALAAALLLAAAPAPAKEKSDLKETWGKWQALSDGFVGRRKVPVNADRTVTKRRLSNTEERPQQATKLQIRLLEQELKNGNGNRSRFGDDFQRRRNKYKGDQSNYTDGRGKHDFGNGRSNPDNGARTRLQQLKQLQNQVNNGKSKKRKRDQLAVWLRTRAEGLYGVSVAAVAAEIGKNENAVRKLARHGGLSLTNAGEPVAWYFDEANDTILFAGEVYDTFYTDENAYRLGSDGNGQAKQMLDTQFAPAGAPGAETPFPDTLKFEEEPDFWFLTWSVASEPDADYWWWDYLYGGFKDVLEVNLYVPNPAPSGTAQLRATLRGWTDLEAGDEHQVYAELNDVPVGPVVTWDGFDQVVLTADFDQSLLDPSGDNVLRFRNIYQGGTHPGEWLDEVEIDYSRQPVADNGTLWLHEVSAGVQTVTGFTGNDILVVESPTGDSVLRTDALVESDGAGGYAVTFETTGGEDYLVSERGAIDTPVVELDEPSTLSRRNNAADYLIIAPRAFTGTAEALAEYRRNHFGAVEIAWLNDIYDEFSYGREDPFAVTRFMETVLSDWRVPPSHVILIGKGSLDHKDRMGYSDSFVPVVMVDNPWSLVASDHRLLAGDEDANFAFGRLPITNDEDGLAYVDKVIAYESNIPGSERYQAVLAADNPDDGGEFHANSDLLAQRLLDTLGFDGVTKFYHPQDPVRQNLILSSTWNTGYISYDGHGSVTQVGDGGESFIKAVDADALQNTAYPVFASLTCAAGDYTQPGTRSLAGSLVLNGGGGAIASLSPTGLSLDTDAQLLSNAFVDNLFGNVVTVGEALRQAKLQVDGSTLVETMSKMYSIVGDPGVYAR